MKNKIQKIFIVLFSVIFAFFMCNTPISAMSSTEQLPSNYSENLINIPDQFVDSTLVYTTPAKHNGTFTLEVGKHYILTFDFEGI